MRDGPGLRLCASERLSASSRSGTVSSACDLAPTRSPSARGVLHEPGAERFERDPEMARLLGRERGRRHAGLGVGLEQDDPVEAAAVVPAEIRAAQTAAAERPVRGQRVVQAGVADLVRDLGRDDVARAAGDVLRLIVVKARRRRRCRSRPGGGRPSPPPSVRGPGTKRSTSRVSGASAPRLTGRVRALRHDVDADRRALVIGLHDIGGVHGVAATTSAFATSRPSATGRPLSTKTAFARVLSMASAEASTPECV